ncbi:hypothetical protein [Aureibacillus halotolerans]|uniref:Uncharacterized protein n=1 Tax=Aureibacillus halotolerans TaxID=1508390 RepID=A0A4R6TS54_9BACI|nr:hypothetical protein [Aureibacillus halotolerans]TDQ35307.1 hypothetical protein EV213_12294 [Aureibacillus halotolerans]
MLSDQERKLRVILRNMFRYHDVVPAELLEPKMGQSVDELIPWLVSLEQEKKICCKSRNGVKLIYKVKENPHKEPEAWW